MYFPEHSQLPGLAKELFSAMDRDDSGSIDAGEFLHAVWIMQQTKEGLKTRLWDGHPSELFASMDTNGNQRLDMDEWMSYLKGMWEALGEKSLSKMLEVHIKLMTAAKEGHLISDVTPKAPKADSHHHSHHHHHEHPKSPTKKNASNKSLKSEEEELHEALVKAAEAGQAALITHLIDQDADPNIVDKRFGDTPLSIAARHGKHEAVKALIEGNADLSLVSVVGASALMQSASHGHKKVVKVLLEFKADTSVTNMMGATAVDVAQQANQIEIVEMLKQHGAHGGENKWEATPEFDLQVSEEANLPGQEDLLDVNAFEKKLKS